MKRRQFLQSLSATATLPALPLSGLATPVATAPATTAGFSWVALFARANGRATPALIQKWLGVGPTQAQAIMSDLIRQNVINAPVAGAATAVKPMYQVGKVIGARPSLPNLSDLAKDVARNLLEDHDGADERPETDQAEAGPDAQA